MVRRAALPQVVNKYIEVERERPKYDLRYFCALFVKEVFQS